MNIKAYAKINLNLRVKGIMKNGFHELETLMQAVKLHDDVDVDWIQGGDKFTIDLKTTLNPLLKNGSGQVGDDQTNLAYKAAQLAHEKCRQSLKGTLYIRIEKNIPIAAGLAGGSSDGAAVLTALTHLWKLNGDDILPIAEMLGSDVPFCLMAQNGHTAAIGRGRGTKLQFVTPTKYTVLLSNPGFGVSTPAVYKAWDENPINEAGDFFNDLQIPALKLCPEIQDTIDYLNTVTPKPVRVQLSGSGPTVFAIFKPGDVPDYSDSPNPITLLTETV